MSPANRRGLLLAVAILLLIVLASLPIFTGNAEFTGDDNYFILNNPLVTSPNPATLLEIWRRPMKIEYFPVTISSYAIEYRLWGGNVRMYHLTNLMLFIGLGVAVRSLAQRLNRRETDGNGTQVAMIATLVTVLCLAHPLNVETVAAISNRKELLCGLFSVLALRCHLVERRRAASVMATILCMVLAQLSKGSAVVLPALLFLAEYARPGEDEQRPHRLRLPMLFSVVAVLIFTIQIRVALHAGVVDRSGAHGLTERAGGVARSLNAMLGKFLWPAGLSYDYDLLWPKGFPPVTEFILPVLLAAVVFWLIRAGRRQLAALVLLALVPLLPYSNIVPLRHNVPGQMVFYDHYLLLSIMLCAPLLTRLLLGLQERRRLGGIVAVSVLAAVFAGYDYQLYGHWKNRETLYQRVIAMAPRMPKGYLFLGKTYNEQGRYDEAIGILRQIPSLEHWFPTYLEVYRELGDAYGRSGRFAEAAGAYRSYLEYQPNDRISLQNLAASLMEQQKYREALTVILQWRGYYPDDADARYSLQLCEQALGMSGDGH